MKIEKDDEKGIVLMCKLLANIDTHYFDLPEKVALSYDAVAEYYGVETKASLDIKNNKEEAE